MGARIKWIVVECDIILPLATKRDYKDKSVGREKKRSWEQQAQKIFTLLGREKNMEAKKGQAGRKNMCVQVKVPKGRWNRPLYRLIVATFAGQQLFDKTTSHIRALAQ